MIDQPLISVIVPVYNVAEYLDECLESIVNQTYRQLEILVVDDGSTDGSGDMCDRWAERDDRIRVIHQPNGGLSAARNTALDIMSGKYVAMVDSDDVIHTEFAATLLQAIEAHHASMAVGEYVIFTDGDLKWPSVSGDFMPQIYNRDEAFQAIFYQKGLNHSPCWRLFDASLFNGIRYPLGQYYEDLAVIYPLLQKCDKVVTINRVLYGYRQRETSILGIFSNKRAAVIDICEHLEQEMLEHNQQYLRATRSRLLSAYFNILLLSNQDKSGNHQALGDRCWQGIKRLRYQCLMDGNVRLKNKLGIITSYMGRRFLCDVVGHNYRPKR